MKSKYFVSNINSLSLFGHYLGLNMCAVSKTQCFHNTRTPNLCICKANQLTFISLNWYQLRLGYDLDDTLINIYPNHWPNFRYNSIISKSDCQLVGSLEKAILIFKRLKQGLKTCAPDHNNEFRDTAQYLQNQLSYQPGSAAALSVQQQLSVDLSVTALLALIPLVGHNNNHNKYQPRRKIQDCVHGIMLKLVWVQEKFLIQL